MFQRTLTLLTCILALLLLAGSCGGKSVTQPVEQPKITTTVATTTATTTPPAKPEPKPAAFAVSNLTISPSEVTAGSPVTIQAIVTNTGELSGTFDINLKIDGTVEATEKVTLAGGATEKVNFARSKFTVKVYTVTIEDQSGMFTVKSQPTTTATSTTSTTTSPPPEPKPLSLTSNAFQNNATVPTKHTCDGQDISPALTWTNAPAGTKSFALICDDPDAPVGIWVHWVIYNIPDTARQLQEALPKQSQFTDGTLQGVNDFGKIGYDGPCPPPGKTHHYQFTLYALDQVLSLSSGASKGQLVAAVQGHILGQVQLVGLYQK